MSRIQNKVNNIFIIGTGLSHAINIEVPLNLRLLKGLIKYNESIQSKKQFFKDYSNEFGTNNIEHLFTHLDLKEQGLLELRNPKFKKIKEIVTKWNKLLLIIFNSSVFKLTI